MERKLKKGGKVWVRDPERAWVEGIILGRDKDSEDGNLIVVQLGKELKKRGGKTRVIDATTQCEVRRTKGPKIYARIDDLTQLEALHEPGLIEALEQRYIQDRIYTFSGKVLLAVNPFRDIKNLYGEAEILRYIQAGAGDELPAHAYSIASRAYRDVMERNGLNQTVLVSGESGAGKTETTKIIMRAISEMSQWRSGVKAHVGDVSELVLNSNPVLEMFGNACTIRNDNSSRFGKMINIRLDRDSGAVLSGSITTYLLEKARLIHQSPNERNFHVFYSMAAGASEEQVERWSLESLASFEFVTQKENLERPSELSDKWHWGNTIQAMFDLGFTEEEMEDVFDTVAGVLHLGNVAFETFGHEQTCRIKFDDRTMQSCVAVCKLLQVDADSLERALCKKVIRIQGTRDARSSRQEEAFEKSLSVEEACQARDALAMTIYERLFGWLVWRINKAISKVRKQQQQTEETQQVEQSEDAAEGAEMNGRARARNGIPRPRKTPGHEKETVEIDDDTFVAGYTIGLLDVFGFEVFEKNGFEQLMINYCNEQLQRLFNESVFKKDQYEYDEEGVDWNFIKYPDNQACIDMIETKPIGLISLMDESCMFPQGSDQTMCNKFYEHIPLRFKRFLSPTREEKAAFCFTIRHFAGDVTYHIDGFFKKNKNELRQEAVDLIRASKNSILHVLLPQDAKDAAGGADIAAYFDRELGTGESGHQTEETGQRAPQSLQQKTVSSHFKAQLKVAIENIKASNTHYVRCLKPNDANLPALLDRKRLVNQLRYSGVLQLIQVARAGYPYRFTFAEFLQRYAVLGKKGVPYKARRLAEKASLETQKRNVLKIAHQAQLVHGDEYQCGKTKIFLRQFTYTMLEVMKEERYFRLACLVQRAARLFLWKLETGRLERNKRVKRQPPPGYAPAKPQLVSKRPTTFTVKQEKPQPEDKKTKPSKSGKPSESSPSAKRTAKPLKAPSAPPVEPKRAKETVQARSPLPTALPSKESPKNSANVKKQPKEASTFKAKTAQVRADSEEDEEIEQHDSEQEGQDEDESEEESEDGSEESEEESEESEEESEESEEESEESEEESDDESDENEDEDEDEDEDDDKAASRHESRMGMRGRARMRDSIDESESTDD